MAKWEYYIIQGLGFELDDRSAYDYLTDFLNDLGKQGWELTNLLPSAWDSPVKYGISCCIPEDVKSVVGSSGGTRGAGLISL